MVCSKCESKLAKLAAPDTWKEGSRNTAGGRDGGRVVGGNKALNSAKRFQAYASKCAVCRQSLHQTGIYCQTCAYAKGVCAMCGVKVLDVTYYKQSGGGDPEAAAKRRDAASAALQSEIESEAARRASEASEPKLAPALDNWAQRPSASRPAAVGTAALAAGACGSGAAFEAQRSWLGARAGCYFGTGERGTGYYADAAQRVLSSAREALAASAPVLQPPSSAAAAASERLSASVPPRNDPQSLARAAAARASLVGGTLTSALGAAGRPLSVAQPGAVSAPPGWPYDPNSGFYFDTASQQYFDPASSLYFDCVLKEWRPHSKDHAQLSAGAPKQRQVDRWGL